MSNTLSLNFVFNRSEVRTLIDGDIIWFVGKDVATILGYSDTDQALRKNVEDEDKLTRPVDGSGQSRNMILINEAGVYSLILSSTLPAAKQFKHWVTHEVLPSIRKQGFYSAIPDQELIDLLVKRQTENPTFLREAAVDLKSKKALEQLSQDAQLRELWSQRAEIPSGEYRSKLNVICNGNITLENKELRKYEKWYAYNRPTGIR